MCNSSVEENSDEPVGSDFHVSLDLKNGIVVSSSQKCNAKSLSSAERILLSSIESNLTKGIKNIPFDHLEVIHEMIQNGNHEGVALYLEENSHVVLFLNKTHKKFLDVLLKVELDELSSESKYSFLKLLLAVATNTKQFSKIEGTTDILLSDYSERLASEDPQFLISVLSLKGNAAFENKKYETAGIFYHRALSFEEIDTGSKAWVLYNLSFFPDLTDQKKKRLLEQALDCFLESGQKEQAIICHIKIADELEYKDPEKAISIIDTALSLMGTSDKIDQEKKAQLHQYKARYLLQINRYREAYEEINQCLNIRKHFLGQNRMKESALYLATILAEKVDNEQVENLKNEYNYHKNLADNEEVPIFYKISNWMESDDNQNDSLESEVISSNNFQAIFGYFQAKAIKQTDFILTIECLDKARDALENLKGQNELWANLSMHYAETYREHKNNIKAIHWYKRTLEYNPYIHIARQNLAALLQRESDWQGLKEHLEDQIRLFGLKPGTCFMYGRTLLKLGDAQNALVYLMKAKNEKDDLNIEEYKNEALKMIASSTTPEYVSSTSLSRGVEYIENKIITTSDVMDCVQDFSHSVSDRRIQFWKKEGDSHKWKSGPEEIGKELFINFLTSRFKDDVVVVDEAKAGAGRIDIFLLFSKSLKIIVELKMCGARYSENYALEGVEQLYHYMQSKSVYLGYLLVFDGRIRDYNKNLTDTISQGPFTIFPKGIDVRPRVKE